MSNEATHGDSNPSYILGTKVTTLYKAMQLSTDRNEVELAIADSDYVIGISQQTTSQDDEAVQLKRNGYTLASVGTGDWTKGAKLTPEAGGSLIVTTTAADLVCAIAMEIATDGEFGEVLLLPYSLRYDSF